MIRRNTRLRREYLYRKSLEGKTRQRYEQKRAIREALDAGKPIPTEIAQYAPALDRHLGLDVADAVRDPTAVYDSEYAQLGTRDPRVLVTTSRGASSRLKQFARELQQLVLCAGGDADTAAAAARINRGSHVVGELVQAAIANGATDLVVLHEHRGDPTGMVVSHLPFGPTTFFGLFNVVLRHDVELEARARTTGVPLQTRPHLVIDGFSTKLGNRVATVLKALFPPFKDPAKPVGAAPAEGKRIVTFANRDDYISFRHYAYVKKTRVKRSAAQEGVDDVRKNNDRDEADSDEEEEDDTGMSSGEFGRTVVELTEIGPRFELRPYQIVLGSLDNISSSDVEWALSAHTNTAKTHKVL